MKKYLWICIILLLIGTGSVALNNKTLFTFSSTSKLDNVNTNYEVDVEVFPESKTAKGKMKIYTRNETGKTQDKIYFQVLANKFKDSDRLEGENWKSLLGPFYESGGLDFHQVEVNGKEVDYMLNDTMLEIELVDWKENEVIEISMTFDIAVPFNESIFSYNKNSINFAYWIPTRAVYNEEGWYKNDFPVIGDQGYNDIANYTVSVTVPDQYQIASTGTETTSPQEFERKKTYTFTAERVREFAMTVMDETYQFQDEKIDGITIRSWYTPDSEFGYVNYQMTAKKAFQYFNQSFGSYPYKEFEIVPSSRSFLGMEFPGMTVVNQKYYNSGGDYLIPTIVHEVAHQWWYGVVGNHTINDPWIDESLTSYSTLQFLTEHYPNLANRYVKSYKERTEQLPDLSKEGLSLSSSTTDFDDPRIYSKLLYAVGPQMFYKLEEEVGKEKMNEALTHYYENNQYRFANKEDLIRSFQQVIGPEVEEYFNQWLNNNPVNLQDVQKIS